MKIKFVLKGKDLNKKWLKSVKSLYGKQKLVISIEPDKGEEVDFDFDDDSWWDEDDFALEIDNEAEGDFNAEEYLASVERQWQESEAKTEVEKVEQKPKGKRGRPKSKVEETEKKEDAPIVETEAKPKGKGGRPKKKVEETENKEETAIVETSAEPKPKGKGGRPKKKVEGTENKEESSLVESTTNEEANDSES